MVVTIKQKLGKFTLSEFANIHGYYSQPFAMYKLLGTDLSFSFSTIVKASVDA